MKKYIASSLFYLFIFASPCVYCQSEDLAAIDDIVFPTIIDAIMSDTTSAFSSVPDDEWFRSYLLAVYKGICDNCGKEIDIAAARYGFPLIRNGVTRNGIPDYEKILNCSNMWRLMKEMFIAITGNSNKAEPAVIDSSTSTGVYYEVGWQDGAMLVEMNGCNTVEMRKLKMKLQELFRTKQDINAGSNDRRRWETLMNKKWRSTLKKSFPAPPMSC